MAYLAAVVVAVIGAIALAIGLAFAVPLARLRRLLREALKDPSPAGVRAHAAAAVDGIRNPLLRRIVTRRIGEMVGVAVVNRLNEQLGTAAFSASALAALGGGTVLFAFFVPGLLG